MWSSRQTRLDEAIEFLQLELVGGYGVDVEHVHWSASLDRISPRTLRRAKRVLGVVSEKRSWYGGWTWRLPVSDE